MQLGDYLFRKSCVCSLELIKNWCWSSAINIIEIWDKQRYEQAIDDATLDFADLAEEVMGGDNGE